MMNVHDRLLKTIDDAYAYVKSITQISAQDTKIAVKVSQLRLLCQLPKEAKGKLIAERAKAFDKINEEGQISKINEKMGEIKALVEIRGQPKAVAEIPKVVSHIEELAPQGRTSLHNYYDSLAAKLEELENRPVESPKPLVLSLEPAKGKKTAKERWKKLRTDVSIAGAFRREGDQKSIRNYEQDLSMRLSEFENTIKNYQNDIVILKSVLDYFNSLDLNNLQIRGQCDKGKLAKFKSRLAEYSTQYEKQMYAPQFPISRDLYPRAAHDLQLMESDMFRNLEPSKKLAVLALDTDFSLFMSHLQNSLSPEECQKICSGLEPGQLERLGETDLNLKKVNLIIGVQIPLKYSLFIADANKKLEKLIPFKKSMSAVKGASLTEVLKLAMSKNEVLTHNSQQVNKAVGEAATEGKSKIFQTLLSGNESALRACLIDHNIRNAKGEIDMRQVYKLFDECPGSDHLFLIFCKSLNVKELISITKSEEISDNLSLKIMVGLDPYFSSAHPVKVFAEIYKRTTHNPATFEEVAKNKENYARLREEKKLTFDDWDPRNSYIGPIAVPQEVAIDSENVLPAKPHYDEMITHINKFIIDPGGNNVVISYRKNGQIVNEKAFDFYTRLGGVKNNESIKATLKKMGDEVVVRMDKYAKVLALKPPGVADKEYIVAHMLYLSTQAGHVKLSTTNNGFTPIYGTSPKDTDCFIDFDTARVGVAQTARGVGVNQRLFYDDKRLSNQPVLHDNVTFIVKLDYTCEEYPSVAKASLLVYDRGPFRLEQFAKGFLKS